MTEKLKEEIAEAIWDAQKSQPNMVWHIKHCGLQIDPVPEGGILSIQTQDEEFYEIVLKRIASVDEERIVERTQRGFVIYGRFTDMYGSEVRVQESSNIKGGLWIFSDKKREEAQLKIAPYMTEKYSTHPHLSVDQTKKLIELLSDAIEHQEEK